MIREKTARFRKPVTMRFLGVKARYSLIFSLLQGHISAYSKCYNIITIKGEETSPERNKIKGGGQSPEGEFFMKNAKNYNVDFMSNSIIVTKSFYKKATSNVNNPEYKELKILLADYPEYEIKLREIKKKEGKKTNRNLTYDHMKEYINENAKNVKADLAEFEKIKKTSCVFPSPYAYVKDWFISKYSEYGKWFAKLETQENKQETDNAISIVEETEGSAA